MKTRIMLLIVVTTIWIGPQSFSQQSQSEIDSLISLLKSEGSNWYLSALQSDDWMTANLATDSLISTTHFAPGKLIRLYRRNQTSEIVKWRIINVLVQRPEDDYLFLLLEALSDPGWLDHNEAALALSRLPPEQVLPELKYLEQSDDKEIIRRVSWVINQLEKDSGEELASMQPYDGYPMLEDLQEIRDLLRDKCLDTISFRKGEIIADVGAGNGYLEAMLSIFNDGLTFYIQDIDPEVCNPVAIQEVVDFYQEVNGEPFTNRFITVNGTDRDSNLPDNTFDKILMLWTYQYLKDPRTFILDLKEKLKNEGLFYVINPEQDSELGKILAIEYGWNGSTVDKQISDIIDCGFELVRISRNYDNDQMPYIMVFRKSDGPG